MIYKEVITILRELIDKLKSKRQQLQKYNTNAVVNETKAKEIEKEKEIDIKEIEKEIDIKVSKQGNISKIEISDYISITEFVDKMNSGDEYRILDLLCNGVLWNSRKQKVNKGIYYVINSSNYLYNILFTDETIEIDERIRIQLDEQTQKDNIIQERIITFKFNKDEYNYFSAKHDKTGDTYYTRYYSKDEEKKFGKLELTKEEAFEEIKSVIYNLENIKGIETILDIELLKEHILNDLHKDIKIK